MLRSAVGILDGTGKLVGSISVADLRDLPTDQFGLLLKPVGELLPTVFKNARLDTIDKDAPFEQLLKLLAAQRLHRVYVLDAEGGPRSIITLTDVLRVVSGCSIPKVRRLLSSSILLPPGHAPPHDWRCWVGQGADGEVDALASVLPLRFALGAHRALGLQARRSLDIQRSFEEKRRAEALAAELAALRANGTADDDDEDDDDDEEDEPANP